ncbi:succinic semialdehyde dehydrogenase [Nadsonia fulvescens var. elongata DSM 6958]|uniref:Succinate-semialdehyde dehydrogenase n=1 Tax=Nadsonia fulvescens var. elongata DSM 6958 TaxID=857566 RepID=A0A1E3PG13_9ASCO|nr:succinic semialdehyde dehydrogenase [Nadsonia fulvescens var. elongata DSM 6958]
MSASYTPASVISGLSNPGLFRQDAYINGQWVKGSSGKTFEVRDPATDKLIGTSAELDIKQVKQAIDDASAAFKEFKKTTPRYRANLLRKMYELMHENKEDLAKLVTLENGKTSTEATNEVVYAASFYEWFSEEAPRIYGDTIPSVDPTKRIHTIKQPIGVCGIITPWNFPAAMITRKVGAAIAAGCTVVIKPGAETPYSALALAELAEKAGVPKGVINIVTAEESIEIGKEFCSNPIVKKISFTGSTRVGKILMQQSSSTLKKLSFELGGNAPFIVFEDADIDEAVKGAIASKFRGTGQTCVCVNRIYAHSSIHDEFAKKLADEVSKFKIGAGFEKDTTHGPMITDRAVAKVHEHVTDALEKGGKLMVGGKPATELGPNFYHPTVISNVNSSMRVVSEETFGPLAAIVPFDTEEQVIESANSTEVGLAAYFYTKDYGRVSRVSEALESGMVGVNVSGLGEASFPFGGVKESGFGREGSKYGLDDYLVIKGVVVGY